MKKHYENKMIIITGRIFSQNVVRALNGLRLKLTQLFKTYKYTRETKSKRGHGQLNNSQKRH